MVGIWAMATSTRGEAEGGRGGWELGGGNQ